MSSAQPFIKWVGGKRQLLPHLLSLIPPGWDRENSRYYEPFVGGGALFFALAPKFATLGDANLRLVRTYRAIRDDVEGVILGLSELSYNREAFLEMRDKDPDRMSDMECAAWFIYLIKTCFNGLYRVNSRGQFNASFGRHENPTICDEAALCACSIALDRTSINYADFADTVLLARDGDLVYFDPPYIPASATSSFTSYTADGFGHADQVRLRDLANNLRSLGVFVMLSNSDTPATRDLYAGWNLHEVKRSGKFSGYIDRRQAVGELIICGYDTPAQKQGALL